MQTTNKKTFWPYAIILSFVFIITACIMTVVISKDYPVELDNYYFDTIDNIDRSYDLIEKSQEKFEAKYSIFLENRAVKIDKNSQISFKIEKKDGSNLESLSAEILLTRPDTNELNQSLSYSLESGVLKTNEFSVSKPGRWQVLVKLNDGELIGFYKFEILAS